VAADEKVSIPCETGCIPMVSFLKCYLKADSQGKVLVSHNCITPTICGCVFRQKQHLALITGDVGKAKAAGQEDNRFLG
jgi:hypothetical protein